MTKKRKRKSIKIDQRIGRGYTNIYLNPALHKEIIVFLNTYPDLKFTFVTKNLLLGLLSKPNVTFWCANVFFKYQKEVTGSIPRNMPKTLEIMNLYRKLKTELLILNKVGNLSLSALARYAWEQLLNQSQEQQAQFVELLKK